jgi:Transposase, Mutator family/Beta-ketoacyl synthase, C-terminal domain
MVAATIRTVFAQPDGPAAREQWRRVAETFRARFGRLAELLDAAEADVLAYAAFPAAHWRHACSISSPRSSSGRERSGSGVTQLASASMASASQCSPEPSVLAAVA